VSPSSFVPSSHCYKSGYFFFGMGFLIGERCFPSIIVRISSFLVRCSSLCHWTQFHIRPLLPSHPQPMNQAFSRKRSGPKPIALLPEIKIHLVPKPHQCLLLLSFLGPSSNPPFSEKIQLWYQCQACYAWFLKIE